MERYLHKDDKQRVNVCYIQGVLTNSKKMTVTKQKNKRSELAGHRGDTQMPIKHEHSCPRPQGGRKTPLEHHRSFNARQTGKDFVVVYHDDQHLFSIFYVPSTVPRASQGLSHLL